jgi:AFG3 family protein
MLAKKEFVINLKSNNVRRAVLRKRLFAEGMHQYELVVYFTTPKGHATGILNVENLEHLFALCEKNGIQLESEEAINWYRFFLNPAPVYSLCVGLMNLLFLYLILKESFMMKNIFGTRSYKKFGQFNIKTRYKDVAGLEEAKHELQEYVDFLKNSYKYIKMGAKVPRGALLVGPPGTGKTLMAKATAGEGGVPFFSVSGSEFVEGYVGVGAKKVRDLFQEARENAPSIIFIDELDAVGKKRSQFSSPEKDNTLNQLLVEMDGFSTKEMVIVLAATNLAKSLDDALTRPGRFDRHIELTLPDKKARKDILKVHLSKIVLKDNALEAFAERLSNITPGFSGAELANLCNEAAIVAARSQSQFVDEPHFDKALERVIGGVETRVLLSPGHKRRIAIHECGKVVASWFLELVPPALKVSLIPRSKKTSGYSFFLNEDKTLQTKEELNEKIMFTLAGKISEEAILGAASSISQEDLKKTYQLAQKMVTKLGMTDQIGLLYLEDEDSKVYSEHTNQIVDKEVNYIVGSCATICKALIDEKKELIEKLADILIEKESLDHKDLIAVLGPRPFDPSPSYEQYLKEHQTKSD